VNGKTLHLVQRIPPNPSSNPAGGTGPNRVRANTDDSTSTTTTSVGGAAPGAANDVQNIINQLIGGLGEFGQNAIFNTTTVIEKKTYLIN
jgi:hypothetical protein